VNEADVSRAPLHTAQNLEHGAHTPSDIEIQDHRNVMVADFSKFGCDSMARIYSYHQLFSVADHWDLESMFH
jgi:hypothetical protein